MKSIFETLFTWAVTLVAGLAYAGSGILDRLSEITGLTALMLLAATVLTVLALGLVIVAWMARQDLLQEDSVDYRTADKHALARDLRRIRAGKPARPLNLLQASSSVDFLKPGSEGRRFKTIERPDQVNGRVVQFARTAEQVRAAGVMAAVRELAHGVKGVNPHQQPSRWHVLWQTSYERRLMDTDAAEIMHPDHVHARAQVEA